MTGKTRRRMAADDRRSQLIEEATRLISEVGFRRFTIAELARACGLTRAGVLHHYASKEELLLDVLEARDRNDADAVFRDAARHGGDIRTMLDLLVRRNLTQPEIVRLYTVLAVEALDPGHPAHRFFADRWERTIGWLAEYLDGFERPARDVAIEIHSFMDGLQVNWLRDPTIDFAGQWSAFADDLFARRAVAGADTH
ncbi:TetR/AcrR family transcriptional regulator [Agromyces sp. MMS24-JH15]|uniref:TetR/AcrR family transcriptional regulator n=1 Tax=Agromyces sp. MMS24-JH15 TaxID=3243765 RepID=UPI0037499247